MFHSRNSPSFDGEFCMFVVFHLDKCFFKIYYIIYNISFQVVNMLWVGMSSGVIGGTAAKS